MKVDMTQVNLARIIVDLSRVHIFVQEIKEVKLASKRTGEFGKAVYSFVKSLS